MEASEGYACTLEGGGGEILMRCILYGGEKSNSASENKHNV